MGNRITNNGAAFWSGNSDDLPLTNKSLAQVEPSTLSSNSSLGATSKLFEANNDAQILRQQIAAKYVPNVSQQRLTNDADLRQRADGLSKVFTGGGKRTDEAVAPFFRGLSAADAKQLRALYQQQTGRDLLKDVNNYLLMEDRLSAFKVLAPERVH